MNRKKKTTKKFTFEPKIPTQDVDEIKVEDILPEEKEKMALSSTVKGKFCPLQLSQSKNSEYLFDAEDSLLVSLPCQIENLKFVVFEDDTCGLRIGEKIIKLDSFNVEHDITVEHSDSAYKVSSISNYLVPKDVL